MEDLTGKQFGQYQIVAPLGEGGMAAIYKAYQPAMERHVAIKILPRHMSSSEVYKARFRREARLLAQLQHPHILPVFDYGEEHDYPYLVMPLIPSGTLAHRLRKGQPSLSDVRGIITQIGDALSYAHLLGMIHRDIKPSNILIDESGNCLLTDFGLARMTESVTQITGSDSILGTPAYMSPEQGIGSTIDGRSDIYSLGIILYEMVTGRVPFIAETPIAVVYKHVEDPLPSVHKFNPNVPEAVELILLKALAKKPEDRYQKAEDFVRAVRTTIPETPSDKTLPPQRNSDLVRTSPPPKPTLAKKWILPGVLVLAGLLALGIFWMSRQFSSQSSPFPSDPSAIGSSPSIPVTTSSETVDNTSIPPSGTDSVTSHLSGYLNDVQVVHTINFDDESGNDWSIESGAVQNGVMELIGNEDWLGASYHGSLSENEGVVIDFNSSSDALFEVYLGQGMWNTDQYRRFGLYVGSKQADTNEYTGVNDYGGVRFSGNLALEPGTTFSLLIAILPEGGFLEAIWDPSNPAETLFHRGTFDRTGTGPTWTFWIGVNQGTVQFDDFREIKFNDAK